MTIKNLFLKPLDRAINGVVKADQNDEATVYQELDEYVVTNELEKHFRAFFDSYSTDLNDPSIANRVGVWISGFFGSGKSHFLKTLSYILANIQTTDTSGNHKRAVEFFDQQKIRDAMIRADIEKAASNTADVILFNIDSKASSNHDGNPILNVFLRVFNEHQGFSSDHPHIAHMERHLSQKGVYPAFKQAFNAASGMVWEAERDAYHFYQDAIEAALSECLGLSADAAHKWFEESEKTFSVSVENFCTWVKDYLDTQTPKHRVLFLVDEVGQFIGSDTKLMLTLQTITENLGTICKGRAWIIVTSQADMDAILGELSSSKANDFSKIAGRFKTRLSLSSSNTDEVIQKRLLRKTPEAEAQLTALFDQKGDILKNQLSFDRSGPTLKNFDGPDSFVKNYPFAPYHFQLVQKVFEEIRKVGATGAHLAYGERSLLDAFQMAAQAIAAEPVGALIPMHRFYSAIEGFLDPAVKRTIDQAKQNASLDSFDVQMLCTLFMIRYVDLIKGTLDNLVTLSIAQIDEDKLSLRKHLDASLQRLEKESLITRIGDMFQFLTNEERDITRQIKATEIASSDENKELNTLIFKDLLKDKNKYRYPANKFDYSIGRYLDGHTTDGRYDSQLKIEFISPLDVDYPSYTDAGCINKSGENQVLIKLADDPIFYSELRTYLKTNKFIRLTDDGSQPEITRILQDRGRENRDRKIRLLSTLEDALLTAPAYALGQQLKLNTSNNLTRVDEACQYLLENTYTKLSHIKTLQADPARELNAILQADDMGQLGLDLDGEAGNPLASKEVEQYIILRGQQDSILLADIIERFTKKPYGWPDAEILLVLGRLAAAGRISFMLAGATLALKQAFEPLQNSRRRKEITIIRKRQTDEGVLTQARDLTQKLFSAIGPSSEKDLRELYGKHLGKWLANLKSYKSKIDVGRFPGKRTVELSLLTLERLNSHSDNFEFFKQVVESKNDYLDLEEDYRDIHEFFTNQLHTWQQLQNALRQFDKNKQALESDANAKAALAELQAIESADSPYALLHKVAGLITSVQTVNDAIITERRALALNLVNVKINQLEAEIAKSGLATPELSNKLLRPLQHIKQDLETETSIAGIYMLQSQTIGECLDESLYNLDVVIKQSHEQARRKKIAAEQVADVANPNSGTTTARVESEEPTAYVTQAKPIIEVTPASIFSKVSSNIYLETQTDIDHFVTALKQELQQAIASNKRVRIR